MIRDELASILRLALRKKLADYRPESNHMPFHHRLLGADRMALFSFIQSLNTTFGTSFYEPLALALAQPRFVQSAQQVKLDAHISDSAQAEISAIMNGLKAGHLKPNSAAETDRLRAVIGQGTAQKVKLTQIDVFLVNATDVYAFDVKTPKPNMGEIEKLKRMLLEWKCVLLAQFPNHQIHTALAFPYNPYAPAPYARWTVAALIDADAEIYVAEEFWDFVGGEGSYPLLLDVFEQVGQELRPELDAKFAQFR